MSGIFVIVLLIAIFFVIRLVFRKSGQAITRPSGKNSKRYFPAEGMNALLEEKYANSGGHGYRACFLDDDGDWWNVKVPPDIYDALEVDSHELLQLDAGGEVFIRFGDIRDETVDLAEVLPELDMELDMDLDMAEGEFDEPDMLSESEWDEQESFWENPLPPQVVALRTEVSDLREFDPADMLTAAGLPKYMLLDGYVKELVAEVYATAKAELSGYEGYPRQTEAGNILEHRGNTFHLYMTILENQPPFDSKVESTLSVNQMDW